MMISLETLLTIASPTLQVIGHLIIALVVLSVHTRVAEEHRIDNKVITSMKKEQVFVVLGIILIIIGYAIEMFSF